MSRFVRGAALAFTIASTLYWLAATDFIEVIRLAPQQFGLAKGSYFATWVISATAPILYSVFCVLFCHWFARQIIRRSRSIEKVRE